jgi:hypothetical protein
LREVFFGRADAALSSATRHRNASLAAAYRSIKAVCCASSASFSASDRP